MFSRRLFFSLALLTLSVRVFACDSAASRCVDAEQALAALVNYRSQAIETTFGAYATPMPDEVRIQFVSSKDERFHSGLTPVALDIGQGTMAFMRGALSAKLPNPLAWAKNYWPYYNNPLYTNSFPIIASIDSAIWSAYLREAARQRGLAWPHSQCGSIDLGKRLPCEMMVAGVLGFVTSSRDVLFNENRIDQIWPSDFTDFRRRLWRREDREYIEVRQLGGILLLRSLIDEFGPQRTFVYIAQHPFDLRNENLRASAIAYQEGAREALRDAVKLAAR
jgi:hypothetical protein